MLPPALPPEGGGRRGVFREELFDGGVQQNMNFLATVDLVNAIVLEQSCDTLSADRILLARLVDLEEKEKAKEKWDQVRDLGNSLRQPTRLYLADESAFGFPKRYVDLGAKFTLARDDLLHFIQAGNRKATLDQKGLIYLQHRLSVLLSRIARDLVVRGKTKADAVLALFSQTEQRPQGVQQRVTRGVGRLVFRKRADGAV